ncbi:hypothetical protein [Uliginosibacterium sp. H1]|uniref:hypothetical protein n=1 Tax=Uliginosibacterium sp. H1 TaxID=3114757 RepID=UPI002E199CE2|nr:hypothetical protein [Uliginosibacterium sp. H1]
MSEAENHSRVEIGCVHGRFQPLHLDHLEYILAAFDKANRLIIGITQPDVGNLKECVQDPHRSIRAENPLTYEERCEAIAEAIVGSGVNRNRFEFTAFPIDQPNLLSSLVPLSVVCFTTIRDSWNREKINRLLDTGYKVEVLWDRSGQTGIAGTNIREMIRSGNEQWQQLVPATVSAYLTRNRILDRIRNQTS